MIKEKNDKRIILKLRTVHQKTPLRDWQKIFHNIYNPKVILYPEYIK